MPTLWRMLTYEDARDDVGDPDTGNGQGNCNLTRTIAAQALVRWLASDPTLKGDPDYLIIGDLNAYAMEDPIATLEAAGYIDIVDAYGGDTAYSYAFEGQFGYLDQVPMLWWGGESILGCAGDRRHRLAHQRR